MKLDPNPAAPSKPAKSKLAKAGKPLFIGYFSLAILVGVIGVWSVQARIAGAVIASGMIQVENNRQVVQHPQGGVVGELLVRDGDRVEAGDVDTALEQFAAIAQDAEVTRGLRERAFSMIVSLGGDLEGILGAPVLADQ